MQPAIEDINLKTDDMGLEVFQGGRGQRFAALEINNNFYPTKKETTDEPVPMFNWLKNNNA